MLHVTDVACTCCSSKHIQDLKFGALANLHKFQSYNFGTLFVKCSYIIILQSYQLKVDVASICTSIEDILDLNFVSAEFA